MQITPVRCWLLVAGCKVLFWGKAEMHHPPASAESKEKKNCRAPRDVALIILSQGKYWNTAVASLSQPLGSRRGERGGRGESEENRNVRKTVSAAR